MQCDGLASVVSVYMAVYHSAQICQLTDAVPDSDTMPKISLPVMGYESCQIC